MFISTWIKLWMHHSILFDKLHIEYFYLKEPVVLLRFLMINRSYQCLLRYVMYLHYKCPNLLWQAQVQGGKHDVDPSSFDKGFHLQVRDRTRCTLFHQTRFLISKKFRFIEKIMSKFMNIRTKMNVFNSRNKKKLFWMIKQ